MYDDPLLLGLLQDLLEVNISNARYSSAVYHVTS